MCGRLIGQLMPNKLDEKDEYYQIQPYLQLLGAKVRFWPSFSSNLLFL